MTTAATRIERQVTLDVLRQVREKLTPKDAWTKGFSARTAENVPCDPVDPDATCWCLTGAINAITDFHVRKSVRAIDYLGEFVADSYLSVANFNDEHNHAEVLALVDRAIVALETDIAEVQLNAS